MNAIGRSTALGLFAAAAAAPAPSPPAPSPRPVFESRLSLVYVTVTVHDPAGRVVPDLPASAFEVREDGQPRPITVFSRASDEGLDLDVALLLDTSGSMTTELRSAQRAALAVLEKVPKLRRRTVISFDTDIRFWKPEADPTALLSEVMAARPPNGASAIRSAVAAGIEDLRRGGSSRGVLILLSDGVDFGSSVSETQLFRTIEAANVGIYPIPFVPSPGWAPGPSTYRPGTVGRSGGGFPTTPDTLAARSFLTRLADASGGLVLLPAGHRLAGALDRLLEELASQYVIGFAPGTATPGRSHRLEVRVADRRLKVRHRQRYLSR
ncbi:MAG TPA: VWA domain-containing protein [Vicinamibacteria bacterium]|nr:VWA domain-containing protein [Vicinamibacteria bacterium]